MKKIGLLSPEKFIRRDEHGHAIWLFVCDCGTFHVARMDSVKRSKHKSCGCVPKLAKTKHGQHKSPEYAAWQSLVQRCNNPRAQAYKNYGGRGIAVNKRWLKFENFLADMGPRPSTKHSIDRIDVNGNYTRSNCRWATRTTQNRNTRTFSTNTSGYRGVTFDKKSGKWRAYIYVKNKHIHLGMFYTKAAALLSRIKAERRHWKT